MGKFNASVEDGKIKLSADMNEDGEMSLDLMMSMSEAIQEAFSRSEAVDGVSLVDFGFEGGKLKVKIDSDKDGEALIELFLDLKEVMDELGVFK